MPGPDATLPLRAHDAARELTRLAAAFAGAFDRLSAAAAGASPPARRLALDAAARVVGAQAQIVAALVPESVLLAPARAEGEADPIPLADDPAAVLETLDRALAAVLARAAPVADGALLRTGATLRAELAGLARGLAAAG